MKHNQLAWVAIGLVAIGLIVSPFTTKSTAQPQRVMAHDVVYLNGSKYVYWYSVSTGVVLSIQDYYYSNPYGTNRIESGTLLADADADLLNQGFILNDTSSDSSGYGYRNLRYVRTRPK